MKSIYNGGSFSDKGGKKDKEKSLPELTSDVKRMLKSLSDSQKDKLSDILVSQHVKGLTKAKAEVLLKWLLVQDIITGTKKNLDCNALTAEILAKLFDFPDDPTHSRFRALHKEFLSLGLNIVSSRRGFFGIKGKKLQVGVDMYNENLDKRSAGITRTKKKSELLKHMKALKLTLRGGI